MSTPPSAGKPRRRWFVRPEIVLPVIGVLIVVMALNVREGNVGRTGDPRLSTYSAAPMGARMFYEMAQRFGWRVDQLKTADFPSDTGTVTAVLDPAIPLRGPEVHALLDRVRNGGGLLVMLGDGPSLLADSLQLRAGDGRGLPKGSAARDSCPQEKRGVFASGRYLNTIWPGDAVALRSIDSGRPLPDSAVPFVTLDTLPAAGHGKSYHAAYGFPFGRGRIVIGADPDLLRNDAIRNCVYGLDLAAMQMLGYLGADGRRGRIVFDEYHQGFGEQRGTMDAVAAYLVSVPSGRALAQLLAAGLVLLLTAAPRLIPPRDPERVERRSPLEHVDALGRAYAQVGATRSATARLVRGVRRRVAGGAIRPDVDTSDDAFLDRARRDAPALAGEIALIKKALHTRLSRREFASVGAALEQLELSLTRI